MPESAEFHPIRLHGPWHASSDTDTDKVVRFKVPGEIPQEVIGDHPVTLRRKWNRPPTGLAADSRFFLIVDTDLILEGLTCNSAPLLTITEEEMLSITDQHNGLMFEIPTSAIKKYNQIEIKVGSASTMFQLNSVVLGILS